MLQLIKLIKADIMKLKSTQMIWMHLYVPLLGLIIFLDYYYFIPWSSSGKVSSYLQVLCIVFPILIGMITSMVADQEYIAVGFQNILISSEIKYLNFISKFTLFLTGMGDGRWHLFQVFGVLGLLDLYLLNVRMLAVYLQIQIYI